MDNIFVKRSPIMLDFQMMFDALINKTREMAKWRSHAAATGATAVRDYQTVAITLGRQSGKTTALAEFASRYPYGTCLAICKDEYTQRSLTARYNSLANLQTVLPHLNVAHLRAVIKGDKTMKDYFSQETNFKFILVDDASITINSLGITQKDFNQWVHDNFPEDVIVIRVG